MKRVIGQKEVSPPIKKTSKVFILTDELYPTYTIVKTGGDFALDVSPGTHRKWVRIQKEFEKMQEEIAKEWKRWQ